MDTSDYFALEQDFFKGDKTGIHIVRRSGFRWRRWEVCYCIDYEPTKSIRLRTFFTQRAARQFRNYVNVAYYAGASVRILQSKGENQA